jgi:hypothetical protein
MRHLTTIFLIALLIVLPSCKNIRERGLFGKRAKTLAMLRAQQDSIRVADSLKIIQNRLKAIEEARLDSIRMTEEEKLSFEARYKYNIIVGSFITPEYARAWAEEYRKQGYDTKIIRMDGSRFELVAAESHERFSKAFTRLKQFQDTVDIDTWMYIKK